MMKCVQRRTIEDLTMTEGTTGQLLMTTLHTDLKL